MTEGGRRLNGRERFQYTRDTPTPTAKLENSRFVVWHIDKFSNKTDKLQASTTSDARANFQEKGHARPKVAIRSVAETAISANQSHRTLLADRCPPKFDCHQTPEIVMLFMRIGFTGLSFDVFTFEIAVTTSMPLVILPNTGCFEDPGENQSRFLLLATFMKNCEPPELGLPVLAMDRVPGALVSREMFSSLILPPFERRSMPPVFRFLKEPSFGPPVPELRDFGSLAFGQPNWFMNPGITRWKWTP